MRLSVCTPSLLLIVLLVLGAGVLAPAQETPKPAPAAQAPEPSAPAPRPESVATAVFTLRYADANKISDVLRPFREMLGGRITPNRDLHVISVSGPRELVDACEQAIRRLDVPSAPARNVDLTFFLLSASRQGTAGGQELPSDLAGVCAQLQGVTGYREFRLLDTLVIRAQEGRRAEQHGVLSSRAAGNRDQPYELEFDSVQLASAEKGTRIHLDKFRLRARLEVATGEEKGEPATAVGSTGIGTDIEFAEGQRAVVGVTSAGGKGEALVLVVTGKVLE